jgi:DNA-binding NtrC family response regulator
MSLQPTVLVVEDQLGPRESLRAILQPDYRVLMAIEGTQAIHVVEHEPVDVVLLDLRLPGLSGIEVMEKIKEIKPSVEVIVVTSYASAEAELAVQRLHAFEYIPKPFNVSYLRETVKRAVAHRAA